MCILLKNRINYDLRMSVLSVLLALHLIFMIEKKKTLEEKKVRKNKTKTAHIKTKAYAGQQKYEIMIFKLFSLCSAEHRQHRAFGRFTEFRPAFVYR